jgi:O-acetyl-ADP-ribose deacetylase (regulator of RNase III)
MPVEIVEGDLLDQNVDAIVNAWNRNTIPWWLLLPQGVSGAIKRRAGTLPFKEIAKRGRLKLGEAAPTSAGKLPFRHIIHVAGINDLWRASEFSIREATRNALDVSAKLGLSSVAFPIIGAGSGGVSASRAESIMLDEMSRIQPQLRIVLVRFRSKP